MADQRDTSCNEWLERAVVKIVAAYTEPGQRILLITPPPPRVGPPPGQTTTARYWPTGVYDTLCETNWTVTRLGRSVQTTLSAHPDDQPADVRPLQLPRLRSVHANSSRRPRGDTARHNTHSAPTVAGRGQTTRRTPGHVDSFDLILTAADPRDHSWLTTREWTRLLRPHGTLAVITHGERHQERLVDPLTSVITTLSDCRLRLHDHIALLVTPPTDPTNLVATRTARAGWKPVRHERGHHDLLTFAALDEVVQ